MWQLCRECTRTLSSSTECPKGMIERLYEYHQKEKKAPRNASGYDKNVLILYPRITSSATYHTYWHTWLPPTIRSITTGFNVGKYYHIRTALHNSWFVIELSCNNCFNSHYCNQNVTELCIYDQNISKLQLKGPERREATKYCWRKTNATKNVQMKLKRDTIPPERGLPTNDRTKSRWNHKTAPVAFKIAYQYLHKCSCSLA